MSRWRAIPSSGAVGPRSTSRPCPLWAPKSPSISFLYASNILKYAFFQVEKFSDSYFFVWNISLLFYFLAALMFGCCIRAQPVAVDCVMDGFLMGSTLSASRRAGVVLGLATSVEMSFLSLAVSTRIKRCTASSEASRSVQRNATTF